MSRPQETVATLGFLAVGFAAVAFVVWFFTDQRKDAVVVELDANGAPVACWELKRCDVDVGAERVSWSCGKYGSRRHISAPFRAAEGIDYEVLGLQWRDERCKREDGLR